MTPVPQGSPHSSRGAHTRAAWHGSAARRCPGQVGWGWGGPCPRCPALASRPAQLEGRGALRHSGKEGRGAKGAWLVGGARGGARVVCRPSKASEGGGSGGAGCGGVGRGGRGGFWGAARYPKQCPGPHRGEEGGVMPKEAAAKHCGAAPGPAPGPRPRHGGVVCSSLQIPRLNCLHGAGRGVFAPLVQLCWASRCPAPLDRARELGPKRDGNRASQQTPGVTQCSILSLKGKVVDRAE